jgi:hypothetical protein
MSGTENALIPELAQTRSSAERAFLIHFWKRGQAWIDVHPWRAFLLVLLMALVLNTARLWTSPLTIESGDTGNWWPVIQNVVRGQGYRACFSNYFPFCRVANQVTAQREPVPVLLFAFVAKLTNESLQAAGGVALALNLLALTAVFTLTYELSDTRVALLAALGWASYPPAIKFIGQVSGELVAAAAVAWGMFFFIRALRTYQTRHWIGAGIGFGLGALSRSVVWGIGLALALSLLVHAYFSLGSNRKSVNARLRPMGLFTMVFVLMVLPWVVRNYIVFGRPVIGTTLAGYNLYRHNYMLPTDDYLHYVGDTEAKEAVQALLVRRSDLRGVENEAQMDEIYREEALRIIKAQPLRYGLLSLYRFGTLWFNWQVKTSYGLNPTLLDDLFIVYHALLLATAILGLRGSWRRTWPLAMSIAVVTLLYMATVSRVRYLVIVMPFVITLSALGTFQIARWLQKLIKMEKFTTT